MVRVWARNSDRMRANSIIAFIVSGPRIMEETLDDFGAASRIGEEEDFTGESGQCPTGRTFCVRADSNAATLDGQRAAVDNRVAAVGARAGQGHCRPAPSLVSEPTPLIAPLRVEVVPASAKNVPPPDIKRDRFA